MWAKCRQVGDLPPEELLKYQLTKVEKEDWGNYNNLIWDLINMMPPTIRKEISEEMRDWVINKIHEKLKDAGFSLKSY